MNERHDLFIKEVMKRDLIDRVSMKFIKWLNLHGFFDYPASISHHGQQNGGLFDHSYAVAKTLESMTERFELKWNSKSSPFVVGMFHDLCKLDNYKPAIGSGDPEAWEYNNASMWVGHGEKSVMMLQQHMDITTEELMCIRWHMGAFEGEKFYNNYGNAVTQYPNVLWTHTADMVAARILKV